MRRPRGTLAARSVSKSYGETLVLDRVSLAVTPETRIGVVGPNGIGKTTLLRILAGLETPESGAVTREPPDVTVAYLAQETDEEHASRGEAARAELETVLARAQMCSCLMSRRTTSISQGSRCSSASSVATAVASLPSRTTARSSSG